MVEFWRKCFNNLYKRIYENATLTKQKIKSSVMIDLILPYGIDNIIAELVRRGHLIPLDEIYSREFYRRKESKMGWIKWGFSKIYQYSIGLIFSRSRRVIKENDKLVSAAFLKVIFFLEFAIEHLEKASGKPSKKGRQYRNSWGHKEAHERISN